MICPPLYLGLFLGKNILNIIQPTPFIHAFITLILLPLLAAIFTQDWSISFKQGVHIIHLVACTFNSHYAFAVIASQISKLYYDVILLTEVLPIYVLFVLITPFIAYALARLFPLDIPAERALTFSMSTRNSLAVLPLAFTLPAQPAPLVVAVIITQTIIELLAEIIYIRIIPTWLVT